MTSEISAKFEIKGWDEQPFDEAVGVGNGPSVRTKRPLLGYFLIQMPALADRPQQPQPNQQTHGATQEP